MTLSKGFSAVLEQEEGTPKRAGAPTILVVDDDAGVLQALKDQLDATYNVITASSGQEAMRVLSEQDVTVILSDQRMPQMTGAELLEAAQRRRPEAVRLLITAYADLHAVVDAINRGRIYYFLSKPWQSGEVSGVVAKAVEYGELQRERRQLIEELRRANQTLEQKVEERTRELAARNRELQEANQRVRELARRDPLTGALNRRALDETLELEAERSRRQNVPLSAIMIDIDHFKRINDTCGHAVGDLVLRELGRILTSDVRPYDVVSRYGGEEFVVILPGTSLEQAAAAAERLRVQVANLQVDGLPWAISASFGVAELRGDDDVKGWLSRADDAMYTAKRSGRDRVVCETTAAAKE